MSAQQDYVVQIAQAIADELNAAQAADPAVFSQQFAATRVYDYTRDLEDTVTLRVDVVPEHHEDEPLTRQAWKGTAVVSVAVRQKVVAEDLDQVDALTYLVGQLRDFWTCPPRPLADMPGAKPVKRKIVYPYLASKLRSPAQFASVLELTYNLVSQ